MKKHLRCLLTFFLALVFLSGLAYSQSGTTGAIEGKVLDEQGTPLPGAEVKLSSPDMIGGVQTKITNAEGRYRFVAVPRGTYTVEAMLTGFTTIKKGDIRIFVGQTITVDLNLKIGKLEEEITVRAVSPLVDVKDSQLNATNMDRQMLQTVGAETNSVRTTTLINLAPGVVDRSAMGAGQRTGIQFQLDGQSLLTYIGAGGDWQYPDRDILEEVQISGSGANAEYGNFTGAVMNLITKSGGNSLEGLLSTSYSPLNWNQRNADTSKLIFSLFEAPPRKLYFDAHVGVGGPIIKDKLWFYVSGGFVQSDDEIAGYVSGGQKKVLGRESSQIPKGFAKFTFQPDKNNRFSLYAEYENFQVFNRGLGVDRPTDATYYDVGPGLPAAVNWLHMFSETTFMEAKAGMYLSTYEQRPKNGRNVPERYDYMTGMYSGNWYYWKEATANHYTGNVTLSHHAENFIKGSHDFKVGVEYLNGLHESKYEYTGGFRYTDNYYGYSYVYYDYRYMTLAYSYSYNLKDNGWRFSAFAQDTWKISDRLSINPGVRWQMQRGYLSNLQDAAFYKPKSPFEFRFGLTFDVFGDHTTALKAHYGRFHDSFKTWFFNTADPGIKDRVTYELLEDGTKVETFRNRLSLPTSCDPNIRIPYSDQFTLGLERTLMKDTVVGVTFMYREYKDFIARVDVGDTWVLAPFTYTDNNGVDQTINIYKRAAGSGDSYMVTNPKAGMSSAVLLTPKNKYTALTFTLNKRFSDGWMFHVDYTYSQTKGNHPNTRGGASWGGTTYENPNNQINASGYLDYDAPHTLHVYGTVSLPLGFVLTPKFTVQSNTNWTRNIRGPSSIGRPTIYIEPKGSQRLPTFISLDLRLEKLIMFTGRMKLGLIFDAFNIFNQGVASWVQTRVTLDDFGKATSICDPRFLRVGMRFYF